MVIWQNEAVYTPEEAAKLLRTEVGTVHRLIRMGELGACRLEDGIGIPAQLLQECQRRQAWWTSSSAA